MNGTNATTGKALGGLDHLRQSIRAILTTPIGSRVMRRDFGSRVPFLIDAPLNRMTIADLRAAVVEALAKWETRFTVTVVEFVSNEPGHLEIDLTGIYAPEGRTIKLDGIEIK